MKRIASFWRNESGTTAVEYAVMLAAITVAILGSIGQLALATKSTFDNSGNAVNSVLGK